MFTVQSSTIGLCGDVGVPVSAMVLERDNRTVKQVRIPVHGTTRNLSALLLQLTRPVGVIRNGVPRRRLHSAPRRATVGIQPTPVLGRCVPGVQPQASRPPLARSRRVGGDASLERQRSDAFLQAFYKPLSFKDMSGIWELLLSRALPVTDPAVSALIGV